MFAKLAMKTFFCAAAVFVSAGASAAPFADGGFEVQGAASAGASYCYFGFDTAAGPACAPTATWNGTLGAGLQYKSNISWPGDPTAQGNYYGMIQGLGALSQTFSVASATTFNLAWLDAGRPRSAPMDGDQRYSVTLTGGNGVQTLFTGNTTSFQRFRLQNTGPFVLTAGNYTLSFNGLADGDHTAFIDAVALTPAVPEPAIWAMLVCGFGAVGGALRRRRNGVSAYA